MSRRRRALLAICATLAVAGLPWAIEAYRLLLGAVPWRPPTVPHFRLDTPRTTTPRRHP